MTDIKCRLELMAEVKPGDVAKALDIEKCPYNEWCEWPAGPCIKSYVPGTELYHIRKSHG